jgi:hypothetical protein
MSLLIYVTTVRYLSDCPSLKLRIKIVQVSLEGVNYEALEKPIYFTHSPLK